MARSVGEAAALGLQSGFILGRNTAQQMRDNERQDALDAERNADRALLRQREVAAQERQDNGLRLSALGALRQSAREKAQTLADAGLAASDEGRKTLGDLESADAQYAGMLREMAGWQTPEQVDPKVVWRATARATGQPPEMFLAGPQGEAPPIVQAADELWNGIKSGDEAAVLRGANVIYKPALRVGVGEKSPHGGTIVGKEFVGLTPSPNSTPDNPSFIPTVRVYVRDDARAGDFARMDRANDKRPPGAQQAGATGYYDAPLTEDRSSADAAQVKELNAQAAEDFTAQNVQVAAMVNDPSIAAKMREPIPTDERAILQRLAAAGVRTESKKKVSVHSIPAGGSLATIVTDEQGNTTTTTTQGNPGPGARPTAAQEALALFEKYPERFKTLAQARAFVTPSKAANAAAGLGNVAGGGGSTRHTGQPDPETGLTKRQEAAFKLEMGSVKDALADITRREADANRAFERDTKNPPDSLSSSEDRSAYAARVSAAHERLGAALERLNNERAGYAARKRELDAALAGFNTGLADGKDGDAAVPPASLLKPGVNTRFKNGQTWTLRDGKPVRVQR